MVGSVMVPRYFPQEIYRGLRISTADGARAGVPRPMPPNPSQNHHVGWRAGAIAGTDLPASFAMRTPRRPRESCFSGAPSRASILIVDTEGPHALVCLDRGRVDCERADDGRRCKRGFPVV